MGSKSSKSSLSKIERQLEEEIEFDEKMKEVQEMNKRTTTIILMGAMDTGKSTILKQLMNIFIGTDSEDYGVLTNSIKSASISYIKTLCAQSLELHTKRQRESMSSHNQFTVTGFIRQIQRKASDKIPQLITQTCLQYFGNNEGHTLITKDLSDLCRFFETLSYPFHLDTNIAKKIKILWNDEGIKETFRLRHKYHFQENADYFLNQVINIASDQYAPSLDDFMQFSLPSTGFTEKTLQTNVGSFGAWCFRIIDVGGARSERKKWFASKSTADGFDAMVFMVALNEYNKMCFEDSTTNRMHETLRLFRTLCEDPNWNKLQRIIILNKYDLFETIIVDTPITVCFDDYPIDQSPYNKKQVIAFICDKFKECSQKEEHFVCINALDEEEVESVFEPIMKTLVHSKFSKDGLL